MPRGPELLVDGDILVYRAVHGAKTDVDWGDGQLSSYCDEAEARNLFDVEVQGLKGHVGASKVRIALSDRQKEWRKSVLPTYKGHRSDVKPIGFWSLMKYVQEAYGAEVWSGLEGDDVLGIWATNPRGSKSRVVFSIDKDLRGVPCNLLSDWHGSVETIALDQANRFHLFQALTGDRVDGYSGVPGVGSVKAERILGELPPGERWGAVVAAYEAAGLTRADALVQAQVARILRHGEYDRRTGAVRRWQP